MKKKVLFAAVVSALSICNAVPVMAAGWQRDDKGWWYVSDKGDYVANSWKNIGGRDYYFNVDGYLVKGWAQYGSQWRYFRDDGTVAIGWQQDNGKWYYFDDSGNMQTGFLDIKNKTYYLNEDGSMAVGRKEINGQIWFFESDGSAKKGSRTFEQNGVKYRYKDNILERFNVVINAWEPMPGEEEATVMIKDNLRDNYVEKRLYYSEAAFARDAKAQLGNLLSEEEIEDFLREVEQEYNDIYSD